MSTKLTTIHSFKKKFIRNIPDDFKWQTAPTQIYPLHVVSKYLVLPFSLIQSDHHKLIFLRNGSVEYQIDIATNTIRTPSIVFISTGTFHNLKSVDENLEGYIILIENKVLNAIFNTETILNLSLIPSVIKLNTEENIWIDHVCRLLYEEACREKPSRKVANGLLQAVLYRTLELSDSHKVLPRNQQIAIKFKELVNIHFKEEKTASFYAGELAISANYLNRCVQSTFHKNVKEVIAETAIFHSQILMLDSAKSVSEICYHIGFEDLSHFSRVFKKITALTPTEFKKVVMHDLF